MSIGYKDNLLSTILAKDGKCEFPINFDYSTPQLTLMPEMFSYNNERKYQTLIPLMKTSHLIDDDLKDKLNKCALDFFSGKQSNRTSDVTISKLVVSREASPGLSLSNISIVQPDDIVKSKIDTPSSPSSPCSPGINKSTKAVMKLKPTKTNTTGQRTRHFCKICSTGFTTSGHLSRHNRIHTGEKNHICPHEGCGQRFSRHDNCNQHYRTHANKKKRNWKRRETSS
ncbi:nrg2p [Saccharomyces arboricola H-6]|uniref:Nrg2p n=1 Tax=Saccharomyces arboricola (strain H-6 / AS 2.3317 / CBS 10644) TaxID=1160507 RepID=J8Q530_SACAR|nr:nrg2p [Saccharomyces arboricola H-6]